MKLVVALLSVLLVMQSPRAQKNFVIYGELTQMEDGAVINLYQLDGNVGTGVAKDTVRNGHFKLQSTGTAQVGRYSLSIYGVPGCPPFSLELFAKSGSVIRVRGENKLLKTWAVESDVPEQAQYNRFITPNKPEWDRLQQLYVLRSALRDDADKASKDEQERISRSRDSLGDLADDVQRQISMQEIQLLQRSPVSEVSMEFLKQAAIIVKINNDSTLRPLVASLYQALDAKQKQSRLGQETKSLLFPPPVVQKGERIADADLSDVKGKHHRLADYRGKYILIDFWSIGCGPCMMAVPELKELSLGYKQKLEVIGLSTDIKTVWAGLKNKDMIWTNLNDGQETRGIAARYGVEGIPHYALISPDGILLDTWVGYEKGNLIAKVKEYIKG